MQVTLSHRIALDPTVKQEQVLRQAVGVARFAYNWALAEWKRQYEAGEKPNECKLRRQLNAIKGEKFPWMLDVPKSVPQQAIKNLGQACKGFFQGLADYQVQEEVSARLSPVGQRSGDLPCHRKACPCSPLRRAATARTSALYWKSPFSHD